MNNSSLAAKAAPPKTETQKNNFRILAELVGLQAVSPETAAEGLNKAVEQIEMLVETLKKVLPLVEWTVDAVDPLFKAKAERSVANMRAAIAKAESR